MCFPYRPVPVVTQEAGNETIRGEVYNINHGKSDGLTSALIYLMVEALLPQKMDCLKFPVDVRLHESGARTGDAAAIFKTWRVNGFIIRLQTIQSVLITSALSRLSIASIPFVHVWGIFAPFSFHVEPFIRLCIFSVITSILTHSPSRPIARVKK